MASRPANWKLDPEPGATRERVRDLTAAGLDARAIALALGISTSAVYQHLDRLRRDGVLEEASA